MALRGFDNHDCSIIFVAVAIVLRTIVYLDAIVRVNNGLEGVSLVQVQWRETECKGLCFTKILSKEQKPLCACVSGA